MSVTESDALLTAFVEEARELLDGIEPDLASLAAGTPTPERLARVLRALHTVKGNCGFVGMDRLGRLAHEAESILAGCREGKPVAPATVGDLLGLAAEMHRRLDAIARDGRDSDPDPETGGAPAAPAGRPVDRAPAPGTRLHLDAALLDHLTRLVGEAAHMRNMVADQGGAPLPPGLAGFGSRLDRFSRDLQRIVLDARTEPVSHLWRGVPRLVHDLAAECGKRAVLRLEGGETGIDRMLVDALREPLVHVLRNAVAHGIENAAARASAGKPAAGSIILCARQHDGQVHIDIADDGAGMAIERLRREAVARGLMTAEQAATAADGTLVELVFHPGFTTADGVSSASGRGVGLDAVRTAVERVGGTVAVTTTTGRGTTFRLSVPCALAIRRVLRLRSRGAVYAIPIQDVVELTRAGAAGTEAGWAGGTPVLKRRGTVMPLVHLPAALGEPAGAPDDGEGAGGIAVIRSGHGVFALAVDALLDVRECAVTPLIRRLEGRTPFAGAALERDGTVALLLDSARLMRRAGVGGAEARRPEPGAARRPARAAPTWVTYRAPDGVHRAVPVAVVSRLETVDAGAVRRAGGRWLTSCRDLPLELLDWPAGPAAPERALPVIVCTDGGRQVGLVADRILDVGPLPLPEGGHVPGARDSRFTVLNGEITELIDRFGIPS